MAETIRIQMMDHFLIYIDEKKTDHLAAKSKKGAALIQYLILNEGAPVPNARFDRARKSPSGLFRMPRPTQRSSRFDPLNAFDRRRGCEP